MERKWMIGLLLFLTLFLFLGVEKGSERDEAREVFEAIVSDSLLLATAQIEAFWERKASNVVVYFAQTHLPAFRRPSKREMEEILRSQDFIFRSLQTLVEDHSLQVVGKEGFWGEREVKMEAPERMRARALFDGVYRFRLLYPEKMVVGVEDSLYWSTFSADSVFVRMNRAAKELGLPPLTITVQEALTFWLAVETERGELAVRNLLRALKECQVPFGALVFGVGHSMEIERECSERGVSLIILQPREERRLNP